MSRDTIVVDNQALVASWPATAREAAARRAPAGQPDWPFLEQTIATNRPLEETTRALQQVLAVARQAEGSSTGIETGAGTYDLQVAQDVPFSDVESIIYAASLAGYGVPRLRLETPEGPRNLPWPVSQQVMDRALRDQLRAILPEGTLEDEPAPPRRPARLVMQADTVDVRVEGTRQAQGCDAPDPTREVPTFATRPAPDALIACAERLDTSMITFEVGEGVTLAEVVPLVQALRGEVTLRLVSTSRIER